MHAAPRARRNLLPPWLVYLLAELAGWLSRVGRIGNGRTVPGRVAAALLPDALVRLAAGHPIALVSGTNGKTTTTTLLARALSSQAPVVTNSDGANLVSGALGALMTARRQPGSTVVLEVDEVALSRVLPAVLPEVVVLLNLSRDQLDRTSEVADHVRRWTAALVSSPDTVVVANADDALVVAAVLGARATGANVRWVGAGKAFRSDSTLCPACGVPWDTHVQDWRCEACGLSRPSTTWQHEGERGLSVDGQVFPIELSLPGRANLSNATMAAAAASVMGVPVERSLTQFGTVREVEGRYSRVSFAGHQVRLLLAKNPAGWIEALNQVDGEAGPIVLAVNANSADGTDPSWLWDVPFEQLRGRTVVASGVRAWDVAVRLTYAEVAHEVEPDVSAAIRLLPPGPCDVLANYTAFVTTRAALARAS